MPTWPTTLPQDALRQGYSESPPAGLIRSQPDIGPAKVRRRTTAAVRPVSVTASMTAAQVAIFETFFVTTLKHGSLSFDWINPRTKAATTFRFTEAPQYEADGANFFVSMKLEVLP